MLPAPLGARRLLLGLAAASILAAVAGASTAAYAGTAALSAVYWDAAHQRWRDAATTAYDVGKIATYDYASATVVFAYPDHGPTIGGGLTGSNLKPNFAYQSDAPSSTKVCMVGVESFGPGARCAAFHST
jgi:hypothetical protein